MEFTEICAIIIFFSSVILIFSKTEKELSVIVSSTVFIIFMIYSVSRLGGFLETVAPFIETIEIIDSKVLLKILGIAIISIIAVSICDTSGQKGMAVAIEIISTVEILTVVFPVIKEMTINLLNIV